MKSYLTGRRGNFFIHEEENRIAGNSFHGPPLLSVFRLCQACEPGTENHPLCGWKINGYTNKKITIRFI